MKCSQIIDVLTEVFPLHSALEWDNVGLLVGKRDKEVKKIFTALDATDEVINEAVSFQADMLITHHPMIFSGLKRIVEDDHVGKRVIRLVQSDISCYAMHTNFDVKRMAEIVSERLELDNVSVLAATGEDDAGNEEGIGAIGTLKIAQTVEALADVIKKEFNLNSVTVYGDPCRIVRKVAHCPGSGKSVMSIAVQKGADIMITGDVGYHEGTDALQQGMMVLDAGHDGLEHIFADEMASFLRERFPEIEVRAQLFSKAGKVI